MITKREFFIDGKWVAPAVPKSLDVIDPATEEACAVISLGSPADVDRAVAAARRAFPKWSATPLAERVERLRELRPRAEHELQAYRAAREARMRPHAVPGRRHGTHPLRARPVTRKPRWHHNGLWH